MEINQYFILNYIYLAMSQRLSKQMRDKSRQVRVWMVTSGSTQPKIVLLAAILFAKISLCEKFDILIISF